MLVAVAGAAAVTVYLSFNAGGFFPAAPALAALAFLIVLVVHTTVSESPYAGTGVLLRISVGLLCAYALWALVSVLWSHAPARALGEFDRALLYVLALATFGAVARTHDRVRAVLVGLALGAVAVCGVSFVTRTLPHLWPTNPGLATDRLSYPLTYWNALGLLGSLGTIICVHLASDNRGPRIVRVAGAACVPLLGATVLLTFSRGAILVGLVGLAVYLIAARPRGFVSMLAAVVAPTALAVSAAYQASLLATPNPTSPAAVSQGHHVAVVVALCVIAAAGLRALALFGDVRIERIRFSAPAATGARVSVAVACALAVLVFLTAFHGPDLISRQYQRFVSDSPAQTSDQLRSRLSDASNNGRIETWDVALQGFDAQPFRGQGAGTYSTYWQQHRPSDQIVNNAHSLYLETLSDLGIVGFVALVGALIAIVVGICIRLARRRANRAPYAAALAVTVAWAIHAGFDWDWQMPAVTLCVFILAGAVLAEHQQRACKYSPTRFRRVLGGLAILFIAVAPGLVAFSASQAQASVTAFQRGDCERTVGAGLSSLEILNVWPEAHEVIGYCDSSAGYHDLAIDAFNKAVELDPQNWVPHYGLAIARASAGQDPRAEALAAQRLNPREQLTQTAVSAFAGDSPSAWKQQAQSTPPILP